MTGLARCTGWSLRSVRTGLEVTVVLLHGELHITDQVAASLGAMSAATIDRRLAADRAELSTRRGRSLTKPGSMLKSQIPIRTWPDWNQNIPGFLEVDLVDHDGSDVNGHFCFRLSEPTCGLRPTGTIPSPVCIAALRSSAIRSVPPDGSAPPSRVGVADFALELEGDPDVIRLARSMIETQSPQPPGPRQDPPHPLPERQVVPDGRSRGSAAAFSFRLKRSAVSSPQHRSWLMSRGDPIRNSHFAQPHNGSCD